MDGTNREAVGMQLLFLCTGETPLFAKGHIEKEKEKKEGNVLEIYKFRLRSPGGMTGVSDGLKEYAGTREDIESWTDFMQKEYIGREQNNATMTAAAMREQMHTDSTEVVGSGKPLAQLDPVAWDEKQFSELKWDYMSEWGCMRRMRCTQCSTKAFIVKDKNEDEGDVYKVFAGFSFVNLAMKNEMLDPPEWRRLNVGFWGNPGVLRVKNSDMENIVIYSLFYMGLGEYRDIEKAEEKMRSLSASDFGPVMEEIFGDD